MPSVWFALKRLLTCKVQPSDVHDPKKIVPRIARRTNRDGSVSSSCSGSVPHVSVNKIVNRNGSKRNMQKSQEYNEPINPIVHEVVRNKQTYELKIRNGSGRLMGTLVPGTPGPGEHILPSSSGRSRNINKSLGKTDSFRKKLSYGISGVRRKRRVSLRLEPHADGSAFQCRKCGEKFVKLHEVEAHHLSKHAVTELVEGESSRNIVQLICISSWLKSNNLNCRIERILKVHNLQKTITKFEEYREIVKLKASELSKKHPRCLADGNELLRFHGTTTECVLGINGSSSLCSSHRCCVCRILRHGFLSDHKKDDDDCGGVFTASSSEKALASVNMVYGNNINSRKALIICRVIAGMVHIPLENIEERDNQLEFDSLAGKEDLTSNIQELHSWNPRAVLPCFVIICKPLNFNF